MTESKQGLARFWHKWPLVGILMNSLSLWHLMGTFFTIQIPARIPFFWTPSTTSHWPLLVLYQDSCSPCSQAFAKSSDKPAPQTSELVHQEPTTVMIPPLKVNLPHYSVFSFLSLYQISEKTLCFKRGWGKLAHSLTGVSLLSAGFPGCTDTSWRKSTVE